MPQLPTAAEIADKEEAQIDTLEPNIVACRAICGAASLVLVILRFLSRFITKSGLQRSDWCILFDWVSLSPQVYSYNYNYRSMLNFAVFDICFAITVKYGEGRLVILVTDPDHARMLQDGMKNLGL
ncbi:hypothetical protein TrVFT333_010216 [Trichoderma virens FT-333]|nr:hypothetical protein TrVFT333_010216 [Trichoderma virens FT-333]